MKTLLLILLPLISFGQCEYSINTVDEFTGDKTIALQRSRIAPGLHCVLASINDNRIIYFYPAIDLGCVSSKSYAIIIYSDGTKESLTHLSGIDCSNPYLLTTISEVKSVDKIRVHMTSTHDYTIKDKDFIINGVNCLN